MKGKRGRLFLTRQREGDGLGDTRGDCEDFWGG